jgi:hypothetical protein
MQYIHGSTTLHGLLIIKIIHNQCINVPFVKLASTLTRLNKNNNSQSSTRLKPSLYCQIECSIIGCTPCRGIALGFNLAMELQHPVKTYDKASNTDQQTNEMNDSVMSSIHREIIQAHDVLEGQDYFGSVVVQMCSNLNSYAIAEVKEEANPAEDQNLLENLKYW